MLKDLFHRRKKRQPKKSSTPAPDLSAISGGNSNKVLEGNKKKRQKERRYGRSSEATIDQTNLGHLKHHYSIGERVAKWLHLDPLHKIERQIVSYFIAGTLLITGLVFCMINDHVYHVKQSETLTNYGAHAQFSKTTTPVMTLHHLQMSGDRKTVFIPISFNDMTDLSENAKKYGVFISSARGSISYRPAGRFVLFGDTGRGTIIMHDSKGFANQPLNVFILNYTNLNNGGAQSSQDDTNFDGNDVGIETVMKDFDALQFKINPGAKDEDINHDLHSKDTASGIYKNLFAKRDASYIKEKIKKYRHKIKINENVSNAEIFRLHQEGFDLKYSHVKKPAWLKKGWRPYDAIEPNGVPKNDENKKNATSVASDGANSPLLNKTDIEDQGHYPGSLKKKDGTTTSQEGGANSGNNDDSKVGSIDGGGNTNPGAMWEDLTEAWNNILEYKHDIYTTDAATLYKIKSTSSQQDQVASISKKFKVLAHLV